MTRVAVISHRPECRAVSKPALTPATRGLTSNTTDKPSWTRATRTSSTMTSTEGFLVTVIWWVARFTSSVPPGVARVRRAAAGQVMDIAPPGHQQPDQVDIQQPGGRLADLADGGLAGHRGQVRQGVAELAGAPGGQDFASQRLGRVAAGVEQEVKNGLRVGLQCCHGGSP